MQEVKRADFAQAGDAGLNAHEIARLRDLLQVLRYDANEGALVIDTGRARVVVREDGTVRIDAARIVQVAEGTLCLDAGRIDLN
ncbi:hypothetical protein [Rhodovulum sulfidophilum]|uniref:hypothetical protein n=1 Tax=Rhodovulum sulfidophilum TaxID=35806 RepID=UPI001389BE11|nr:hypothetical protein [Rhodovulum sulfidophilum]MBL3561860.1 hypothetical protein [Rhodovulum sulfidophilum]NDK36837.1 hypothetical protein [Rhodovulum sulfidophilum]